MAYTEFYCQNGGSNTNSGSTNSNTPIYTKAHGNWTNTTGVFTVQDGTNPSSSVAVGDWCAVFVDGATVAAWVARVSAVQNANNGTITVNTNGVGSKPANQTGTCTIVDGGACLGPNAASGYPFSLSNWGNNTNSNGDRVRMNLKNDRTYSITASFAYGAGLSNITQGYTSSINDGGLATIDGGTSTGALITSFGSAGNLIADMIFTTSITSGATDMVTVGVGGLTFVRCVFKGARVRGLLANSSGTTVVESEFYDCNKSNTSGGSALSLTTSNAIRCTVHDNAGSNTDGISVTAGPSLVENCVIDTNGHNGITLNSGSRNGLFRVTNNDIYNNSGEAINIPSGNVNAVWIENNNFIKNTGAGINNATVSANLMSGFSYNNGYGAGTQANGSADTLGNIAESGKVTYASNVTPWVDPANGDFSINLAAAEGAGRGAFTETQSYSAPNTVGYPDIGAAQAQVTATTYKKSSHVFCG